MSTTSDAILSVGEQVTPAAMDQVYRGVPETSVPFGIQELAWQHFKPDTSQSDGVFADRLGDPLITKCAELTGGFAGRNILELGPYEGFHTVSLHRLNPQSILSIEANPRNYFKCLVVKEHYRLDRARFLLGDFQQYLLAHRQRFDFILAAGILYHLPHPFGLLDLIVDSTDAFGICTTYFDPNDPVFAFTGNTREVVYPGTEPLMLYERPNNPLATRGKKHGVGSAAWLFTADDLRRYLDFRGFDVTEFPYKKTVQSGPRIRLLAKRKSRSA